MKSGDVNDERRTIGDWNGRCADGGSNSEHDEDVAREHGEDD
jgi:hypothetical protein